MATFKTARAQELKQAATEKRLQALKARQEAMEAGSLKPKQIFFTDEKLFVAGAAGKQG